VFPVQFAHDPAVGGGLSPNALAVRRSGRNERVREKEKVG